MNWEGNPYPEAHGPNDPNPNCIGNEPLLQILEHKNN